MPSPSATVRSCEEVELRRPGHPGPRGPRAGPQAARHVHRLHRAARPPSPRLRGRRQLGRRGARRLLHRHRRHHPPRQLDHRRRQRPRHPRRDHGEVQQARRRSRAHDAARRRQVRRRGLQGLRRSARRRRLGRQRARRVARGRHLRRRLPLEPALRARQAGHRPGQEGEARQGRAHRHDRVLPARPGHLREGRLRLPTCSPSASARRRSSPRASRSRSPTSAPSGESVTVPLRGRHRRLRRVPQREQGRRSTASIDLLRERDRRRGSVEIAHAVEHRRTPSRSSRSPTTSTRTRAARTSPASGPRSPRTINDYAAPEEPPQGEGREPQRRGHARGPHGDHLGQAPRTRSSRARPRPSSATPRSATLVETIGQRQAGRVPRGEPAEARQIVEKAINAAQARSAARKARDLTRRKGLLEGSTLPGKLADCSIRTPRSARSTSSRATRPAARPSRRATARSRRSCRCAARSSTSRRRASTRCSPTRRSRR